MYLVSTFETYEFYKKFKDSSFYVKIESVNECPENELKRVCANLGVEYFPDIMSSSTCLHKPMLQYSGKSVKGYSKTTSYDSEQLSVLMQAISGYLFNEAAWEFGYPNIDTFSLTKVEVLRKIIFSDVWFQAWQNLLLRGSRADKE